MNVASALSRDDQIRFTADSFEGVNGDELRADQVLRVHRTGLGGKAVLEAYDESGGCRVLVRQPGGQHVIGYGLSAINRGICSEVFGLDVIGRSEQGDRSGNEI